MARNPLRRSARSACSARPVASRITLVRALRSEAVRLRRSPLIALHAALALALGVGAGLYFAFTPWDPYLACDAFFQLLGAGASLLVGISCGLSIDSEREAGEYALLLGSPSRRRAIAAKALVLLGLGVVAASLAASLFCGLMLACGKPVPPLAGIAVAVAGMGAGSAALYVISLAVALKWGRNAAIGFGAFGFIVAIASIGGLANGMVTGTFSGAVNAGALLWLPFSWPIRLSSLPVELAIAPVAAVADGVSQVPALLATLRSCGVACLAVTAASVALGLGFANRFEDARRAGE